MAIMARPSYGIDAPYVPLGMIAGAVVVAVIALTVARNGVSEPGLGIVATVLALNAACYLHATLRGKFVVWARLLDDLHLAGNEAAVDLGCGRGAVLLAVAERLPSGHATGVDLWRSKDQSGNDIETTHRNAVLAGVEDRVELHTGDLTDLPLPDASADVVVSSLAIHNVPDADGRDRAIDEAIRILRPGGRLVIADIAKARAYESRLQGRVEDLRRRRIGATMWWAGPGCRPRSSRQRSGSTRRATDASRSHRTVTTGPPCARAGAGRARGAAGGVLAL